MSVNANYSGNEQDLIKNKILLNIPLNTLRESAAEFSKEKKFSDKVLLKLYSVFGGAFEKALELYESIRVTHVSTLDSLDKSELRGLLQVKGFSGKVYTLFRYVNFCTCKAFRYQVLETQSAFTCKHVLAAWLALLDKEKLLYQKISHIQFRELLLYQVSY